jgi:hypothetical protein
MLIAQSLKSRHVITIARPNESMHYFKNVIRYFLSTLRGPGPKNIEGGSGASAPQRSQRPPSVSAAMRSTEIPKSLCN